jgi:hypothetical protein
MRTRVFFCSLLWHTLHEWVVCMQLFTCRVVQPTSALLQCCMRRVTAAHFACFCVLPCRAA